VDMTGLAFGKPAKRPRSKPSKAIYRDDGTIERIVLSLNDWRKLKEFIWEANLFIYGLVRCHICKGLIHYKLAYEPDHVHPRGNGGCYRDDRDVKPAHAACNRTKGSRRI
jgi:hypothetical protein